MKAKSRKRLLISSVAMLLVAMLALGTATFAWFTSNPNANASGVKLKTTASTGLVVRTETDTTWSHAAKLYNNISTYLDLTPVSQEQTKTNSANLWTVNAAGSGAYGHSTEATDVMTKATEDTDYFAEKVYFALSTGSDATSAAAKKVYITGITINKAANATMEGTIRVAITAADGTMLGTWALANASANGTLTTADKTPGAFSPALATAASPLATNVDTLQTGLDVQTNNPASEYVNVYVYMDGQDFNCFSDNVSQYDAERIIESVQVNFALAD